MQRLKSPSWKKLSMLLSTSLLLAACGTEAAELDSAPAEGTVEEPTEQVPGEGTADTGDEETTEELELLDEKPEVAEVEPNNEPNRIIATFNGDSKTQMGFNWYTTDEFADSKVLVSTDEDLSDPIEFGAEATQVTSHYGERTEDGHFIFADYETDEEGDIVEENGEPVLNGYYTDEQISDDNKEWTSGDAVGQMELTDVPEYSYKALATELESDTTYYYQVGSEEGGFSETGSFTTSGDSDDPFTFVQYTDTQNAYWNENVRNEAAFGADTIETALEVAEDADLVVHSGDLVEVAEVEDEWVDIMDQSQDAWMQQPVAVAPGNHDEYALNYGDDPLTEKFNEHLNVPVENGAIDGGSYYSFGYNNVHFVTLNTNDYKDNPEGKAIGDEQMAWMEQDIKEARANGAEWIILNYHKPIFSRSYHSLQDDDVQAVREEFMAQIDSLDVDLALQGHDHVVSRTEPLTFVPSSENFSNGTVDEARTIMENGVEHYVSPEGTVFILPNTGGTKAYDDIYSKGIDHIHEVRPRLDWLTQDQVDYWNTLFAYGNQPQDAPEFETSHSNVRDSDIQNFAVYDVHGDQLEVEIYQIEGELLEGEERTVDLVHEFGITKGEVK